MGWKTKAAVGTGVAGTAGGAFIADQKLNGGKATDGLLEYGYDAWSGITQSGGQIGVDALKGKFYAMVQFVAEVVNGIGGNNEGMSLDIANWAIDRQIGKERKYYVPGEKDLVEQSDLPSTHPAHISLELNGDGDVDTSISTAEYTTAFNDTATNIGITNINEVVTVASVADPEMADDLADIMNNTALKKDFTEMVTTSASPEQVADRVAELREGLANGQTVDNALKNAM